MDASKIPYRVINHLLDLIAGCDKIITQCKNMGENDNNLSIRQEKHLKNKYLNDLNEILKAADIHILTISKEDITA